MFVFTLSRHGVPQITVAISRGREAWRMDDFLINYIECRGLEIR